LNLSDFKDYNSVKSTIIYTEEQFQEALAWISVRNKLGLDFETDGVNPRKNIIIGIGVGDLQGGYYLPTYAWNKNDQKLEQVWPKERALEFLRALEGHQLVAFNGNFEVGFSEALGWDMLPHFWCDPMLMLHTLDENKYNYGLKENAAAEFGEFTNQSMELMLASVKANGGSEKEYYRSDVEPLGHYCVWDNAIAMAFCLRDEPRLQKEGLHKFFFEQEVMPTYKYAVGPMERNGIRLDWPLVTSGLKSINAKLSEIENEILAEIGPLLNEFEIWFLNKNYPPTPTGPFGQAAIEMLDPEALPRTKGGQYSLAKKAIEDLPLGTLKSWLSGRCELSAEFVLEVQRKLHGDAPAFNISSNDHLGRLFFGKLKEKALSYTDKKRAPQMNEPFLDSMAPKYGWAAKLQVHRRLSKLAGTYFQRVHDKAEEGRFYPSYFSHKTTTGRQSGDFQQLPRPLSAEDEPNELIRYYNNMIRAFFIADPGYKFLDADYNSLEIMVFTDDSGDPNLIKAINEDKDIYSLAAIDAYNLHQYSADKSAPNFLKKHKPSIRQGAKPWTLGFRYGLDPYKLHMDTGMSKDEADQVHKNYFAKYAGLRNRMQELEHQIQTYGFVQSKFGRKRREPKAVWMSSKYGPELMDSLKLWKKYHEEPSVYERMKSERRIMKSILNNAYNFPIQSAAASIVSRAAWNLALWLKANCPQARIVAMIHDQIVVHCPEEHIELVRPNMKRIMEQTTQLSVPLTADPVIAENLRDGH
jgi:DNA polymerase I-like protein with 3'-5' exonuclease and polymerase domains